MRIVCNSSFLCVSFSSLSYFFISLLYFFVLFYISLFLFHIPLFPFHSSFFPLVYCHLLLLATMDLTMGEFQWSFPQFIGSM